MRAWLWVAAAVALAFGGCSGAGEGVAERYPHEWRLPGPKTETTVFGPLPYEEVKDLVRQKESEGWRVVGYDPGGPFLEGRYLVVMERWSQ